MNSWEAKQILRQRLASETGSVIHPAGSRRRFALVYPNLYRVGMSNLGIHILYKLLNDRSDTACERFFLPERQDLPLFEKFSLMSLETQTEMNRFDVIGFSISFEMDYFNVLKMLDMGRIKLKSSDRGENDPIVIAGGPCSTFNPEPLADFFDAFVIGEGEVILPKFLDTFYKSNDLPRSKILENISKIPGIYVPSLKNRASRQWIKNIDDFESHTTILTDDAEFDLYLIETARGCGRHCRFCMAGYCFRKPRNHSIQKLFEEVDRAKKFNKRIGLMGAAISDYPEIDLLTQKILDSNLKMSVASFRADSVTEKLVDALAKSGHKTLTLAPEAGSNRMRAVINKGISEEDLFRALDLGIRAGIKNFRLYFLIGLPFETREDIQAIIDLTIAMYNLIENLDGKLTLSINPLIPKPFTPFQWQPMASKKYLEESLKLIRSSLKKFKRIEIIAESIRESNIQSILARGDRQIGRAILKAHELGGSKNFLQAMKLENLDVDSYLRGRDFTEDLPWDILDMGFPKSYLQKEFDRAKNFESTPKCFEGCKRCGVCREGIECIE